MKKLLTTLFLIVFAIGLFFVKNSPTPVKADVGAPLTITATYNSSTGQLNTSGSYAWEECEPGEETNILGFALFINGGTPAINDSNALDGAGMHLANSGNPCTTTSDDWVDNNHVLSSAPTNVCVVVYDVRADDSADPGGTHSTIGAGDNHNIDNSWDRLEEDGSHQSYLEGSCTTPTLEVPTPTPSSIVPLPTPTLTPSGGGPPGVGGPPAGGGGGEAAGCNAAIPPIPTLLTVTSAGLGQANLTWSAVDPATHYAISYGLSSGNYIYGVADTGKTTSFTIGELDPAAKYCFAVRAVNGCAPSGLSNEICQGAVGGGRVLGVSTLGATGTLDDDLLPLLFIIGSICASAGLRLLAPRKLG